MYFRTCKVQYNCKSTIRAEFTTEEQLKADICYTHYGHERDLQHTWITKSKRQKIASLKKQGVTRDRILNDIREEAMQQESEFTRYNLAAKKDLANIISSFGVSKVQRHPNDQESVTAWIERRKLARATRYFSITFRVSMLRMGMT